MRATRSIRLVALLLTTAGCGTGLAPSASVHVTAAPGPSVAPTQTAGSTTSPSAEPTGAPAPQPPTDPRWANPAGPILVGAVVRVVVEELNLRSAPTTSAPRRETVRKGALLPVAGLPPPVDADGYTWYRTSDLYFAASRGSTSYVVPVEPQCPAVVDFASVSGLSPAGRLACFGDATIELEGSYGCAGCMSHIFGSFEPSWIANPNIDHILWDVPMVGRSLMFQLAPTGPPPPEYAAILRVRGHFDDPTADDCRFAIGYWWEDVETEDYPVPDRVSRELCRQEFVVESYEMLGKDPRFEDSQ